MKDVIADIETIEEGFIVHHKVFGVLYIECRETKYLERNYNNSYNEEYTYMCYINGSNTNMSLNADLKPHSNQNYLVMATNTPLQYHLKIINDIQKYLYPEEFL